MSCENFEEFVWSQLLTSGIQVYNKLDSEVYIGIKPEDKPKVLYEIAHICKLLADDLFMETDINDEHEKNA